MGVTVLAEEVTIAQSAEFRGTFGLHEVGTIPSFAGSTPFTLAGGGVADLRDRTRGCIRDRNTIWIRSRHTKYSCGSDRPP